MQMTLSIPPSYPVMQLDQGNIENEFIYLQWRHMSIMAS